MSKTNRCASWAITLNCPGLGISPCCPSPTQLGRRFHTDHPRSDQIGTALTPVPTEVFAFAGYAGERTKFVFGTMQFGATTSLARELYLEFHAEIDSRFHLGLGYLPDSATSVVGDRDLPKPPGLSGATVWNTCFVEAKAAGVEWSPEQAKVAGVVRGWPSGQGVIVATKAEHVRRFLLGALHAST